jgi:hypothetical protein
MFVTSTKIKTPVRECAHLRKYSTNTFCKCMLQLKKRRKILETNPSRKYHYSKKNPN